MRVLAVCGVERRGGVQLTGACSGCSSWRSSPPVMATCATALPCVAAPISARLPLPWPARSFSLVLSKNARSRFGEDTVVSKLVIKAVAESMGVGMQVGCWLGWGGPRIGPGEGCVGLRTLPSAHPLPATLLPACCGMRFDAPTCKPPLPVLQLLDLGLIEAGPAADQLKVGRGADQMAGAECPGAHASRYAGDAACTVRLRYAVLCAH